MSGWQDLMLTPTEEDRVLAYLQTGKESLIKDIERNLDLHIEGIRWLADNLLKLNENLSNVTEELQNANDELARFHEFD